MKIVFEIQTDEDKEEFRDFFRRLIDKAVFTDPFTGSQAQEKSEPEPVIKKHRGRKPGTKNKRPYVRRSNITK